MKKTAVLLYPQFCMFEISVALEMLAMVGKPITVFAKTAAPVKSEEGLTVQPEKTLEQLALEEYDSLLLPGAADIRDAVEDEETLDFVRRFGQSGKVIGAISIAPVLLVKSGVMGSRRFMAGINPEDLLEEGFSPAQLAHMWGWNDNLQAPIADGYICSDNIVTSVSYEFVRFAAAFGKLLGIEIPVKNFGIRD